MTFLHRQRKWELYNQLPNWASDNKPIQTYQKWSTPSAGTFPSNQTKAWAPHIPVLWQTDLEQQQDCDTLWLTECFPSLGSSTGQIYGECAGHHTSRTDA